MKNKFYVDRYCFENNLNYQEFCEKAKIELEELFLFFEGNCTVTLEVLFRIAYCINIDFMEIANNYPAFYDAK